jgi:hypothetical protein
VTAAKRRRTRQTTRSDGGEAEADETDDEE